MKTVLLSIAMALVMTGGIGARQILFDFESEKDIEAWTLRSPQQDRLAQSQDFASAGDYSMVFMTPEWEEGMEQWPALEAKPPVADWTEYERMVVDITNPGEEEHFLSLFVSDSKVPFREGLSFRLRLPSQGYERYEVPLSQFPDRIDRSDISIIHFFGERPETDMALHIDNIMLLKPGEKAPEPKGEFVRQLAALSIQGLDSLDEILDDCRQAMYDEATSAQDRRIADAEVRDVTEKIQQMRQRLGSADLSLADLNELRSQMEQVRKSPERMKSVFRLGRDFAKLPFDDSPMLVGFASPMVKLLPRGMPFELDVSESVSVSVARNEKESFQVAVMPASDDLQGVSVSVDDLSSDEGDALSAEHIDCDVVGYVQTKKRPPYTVPHVGWWPDPILDFLGPVDIAASDLQSFWIRVRAPEDQPAGEYTGKLRVNAEGADPLEFDLSVRVRNFTLPDHTPLPTAITFFERKGQMGGEENWNEMKFKYADFLADYYIDYDSLYRRGTPDYEIVQHLHDQGRLVAFNLGNVFNAGTKREGLEERIAQAVDNLRPAYEEAKRLGLLDHAYIYGFDERPKDQFPILEQTAQALEEAFPEVLLMTTARDKTYGLESVVETIDAWCPLTPDFRPERAERARAQGKYVWWYICCGPHHPYANWFVEYPAIEARLLMGAMTAKYGPDGFLYYSLTIWNENEPIDSGPFTNWNPVSWTVYHGDGSLLCSGPGGKPVPTIRLENYRDGMEDFAYACILREIIRKFEAREGALSAEENEWLEQARAAAAVPDSLVEDMANYSHDPRDLTNWRHDVADLIERSGISDADPWGENFGVRGFE